MSLSFSHLRRPAIFAAIVNSACQSKPAYSHVDIFLSFTNRKNNFQEYKYTVRATYTDSSLQAEYIL